MKNLFFAFCLIAATLSGFFASSYINAPRYQAVYVKNSIFGFDLLARLDTKTGEIETFILDPTDQKFKKSLD